MFNWKSNNKLEFYIDFETIGYAYIDDDKKRQSIELIKKRFSETKKASDIKLTTLADKQSITSKIKGVFGFKTTFKQIEDQYHQYQSEASSISSFSSLLQVLEKAKQIFMLIDQWKQSHKELTDKEFNDSLKYTIDNIDFSSLWVGSHNENSCKYLMELMKENNIKSDDNRIWFSQLFGMSDNISFTLSDIGYNVVKLIPYGPIEKTIPYLIRRANENSSVKGQSNRQFTLIKNEINRRKKLN